MVAISLTIGLVIYAVAYYVGYLFGRAAEAADQVRRLREADPFIGH